MGNPLASIFDGQPIQQKGGLVTQVIWDRRQFTANQEAAQLSALGAGWYYNYNPTTDVTSGAAFYPMLFKHSFVTSPNIAAASAYGRVMGFNEPDQGDPQANMTVAQAVGDWPSIVAGGAATIVGPSNASNMDQTGSWTGQFMLDASNPRVDVMSVHYYTAVFNNPVTAANNLMGYLGLIYRQWRKQIILSEFGMIDFQPGGPANWLYPTVQQAIDTMAEMVKRLRNTPWLIRFAWYPNGLDQSDIDTNPNSANVRLSNLDGSLTSLGTAYKNAIEIPPGGVLS